NLSANSDNVFYWSGTTWSPLKGQHLTALTAAADGTVLGLDIDITSTSSNVFRCNGAAWTKVDAYLTAIATVGDGSVWGINDRMPSGSNNVFRWDGNTWQPAPRPESQIDVRTPALV